MSEMKKETEVAMMFIKVPTETLSGDGSSQQVREVSKAFDLDTPLRDIVQWTLDNKTHVGQLVCDNSAIRPTTPLLVPRPIGHQ